jgi:hypothetical protein
MKIHIAIHRAAILLAMAASLVCLSGCAEYQVMKQPGPFKPAGAVVGASRVAVAAELGGPVNSERQDDRLIETYRYVDGGTKNHSAMKTCRFVLYCAGDLFTIGLDQAITSPLEKTAFGGTVHLVTVAYEKSEDGFWRAREITDVEQGRSKPVEMPRIWPEPANQQNQNIASYGH